MLKGTVYLNNSDIPLLGIGEGDHALQCRTSRDGCCRALPNRFGDFYYPNGTQVFNERSGYGVYRNRGQKVIHLNRREGVTEEDRLAGDDTYVQVPISYCIIDRIVCIPIIGPNN